jgi:hypothetical protein
MVVEYSDLYTVKTNPSLGPVFISHNSQSQKSIYVIAVYPDLPADEIKNRKNGITHLILHPIVRISSLVKISPEDVSKKLLLDWQKQIDESHRYPGWGGRRIKIPAKYKKIHKIK